MPQLVIMECVEPLPPHMKVVGEFRRVSDNAKCVIIEFENPIVERVARRLNSLYCYGEKQTSYIDLHG